MSRKPSKTQITGLTALAKATGPRNLAGVVHRNTVRSLVAAGWATSDGLLTITDSGMDALRRGLTVMDSTALTFCMDNNLPIVVFDLFRSGNAARVIAGEHVGTLVTKEPRDRA